MSSVSVCASCKNLATIFTACSKCFKTCCVACYSGVNIKNEASVQPIKRQKFTLLPIRLCPKCNDAKVSPNKSTVIRESYGWNQDVFEKEERAAKAMEAMAESSELLSQQYEKLKVKYIRTMQRLESITSGYDYNYSIMHYKPYLWNLASMIERHSLNIMDRQGQLWCLIVHPTADQSYIEAYVTMVSGSPTKCSFFIELSHTQSKKSIVKAKTGYFEPNMHAGWNQFITSYELVNDAGFYPDGCLNFRFGVRPFGKPSSM